MVSSPEPVVIVLAADEPVTVSAEPTSDASRFSKFDDADAVARRLVGAGRDAEIDRRHAAAGGQHQRVGARAAIDRGFGAAIRHGVVAAAGIDRVGAAGAIDRVVAGAAGDGVGAPTSPSSSRRATAPMHRRSGSW